MHEAYNATHEDENKARQQEYRDAHREEINSRSAAHYVVNRDEIRERHSSYDEKYKDVIKKRKANYYVENREKIRARNDAYIEAHPTYRAEWRAAHPEIYKTHNHRYRAAKRNATIGNTAEIAEWIKTLRNNPRATCFYCGRIVNGANGKECHIDHYIPIIKGGPHSVENLRVACRTCNLAKGDKHPDDFLRTRKS
jgi:5-methylcytosine-specific restriction endonuclease McrA